MRSRNTSIQTQRWTEPVKKRDLVPFHMRRPRGAESVRMEKGCRGKRRRKNINRKAAAATLMLDEVTFDTKITRDKEERDTMEGDNPQEDVVTLTASAPSSGASKAPKRRLGEPAGATGPRSRGGGGEASRPTLGGSGRCRTENQEGR